MTQKKRIKKWPSIAAVLLTIAAALLTRLVQCFEQGPVVAQGIVPSLGQCDPHTVVGAIIGSIADSALMVP